MNGWKSAKDPRLVAANQHGRLGFLIRISIVFFLLCALLVVTGWTVLAIYYGDSATNVTQTTLAIAFGILGFATMTGVFVRRWRWRSLAGFSALFAVVLLW